MLKIIGYILLLSLVFVLIKFVFSFTIALLAFTITAFMSVGTIVFILSVIGVIEPGTAWVVLGCAVGIGAILDAVRFFNDPGEVLSDARDNFNTSSHVGGSSRSDSSRDDTDYRYQGDQYRRCCGSCRWFSSHSSHYSICTLHGREMSHSDSCSDWQS